METECLTLQDLQSLRKSRTDMDDEEGKHDQKENIFTERRKATPHKNDPSSVALVGRKGLTPERINVTPIKPLDRVLPEPWTPTANLKVLISAISPDIRDREMKKILFRPIENGGEEAETLDDAGQFDAPDDGTDDFEKRPSRKQKSLGLLCQKFLSLYPDYPASSETTSISLDEVATSLGVERRRIYDIVNVLESLMLVSRVAKNHYLWHGRKQLRQTLRRLQGLGKQQGYHRQMEQLRDCRQRVSEQSAEEGGDADSGSGAASKRKEKSLRIMSQKFVMLFLVSETLTVTLDVAAKILIEESQDTASHSKYKTKVRRLYDIANVLTSLGLIQKVHVNEERGRKPAFKWIGPADFQACEDLEAVAAISFPESQPSALGGGKQRLARHASFNVVPTSVTAHRRVSSAPSSPRRAETGPAPEPVDYSRRAGSSSAVCRLHFGDDRGTQPNAGLRIITPKSNPMSPGPVLTPLAVPVHQEAAFGSLPSIRAEMLLPHLYPGAGPVCSPVPPAPSTPPRDDLEACHPQRPLPYVPNLPQPSVVMLYSGPALERADQAGMGQRSPTSQEGILGKRKMEEVKEEEEEEGWGRKRALSEVEQSYERRGGVQNVSGGSPNTCSPSMSPNPGMQHPTAQHQGEAPSRLPGDGEAGRSAPLPSHYLYVPNSAGLNGLNFLLSAGSSPGGLALPQGSLSTLMPYVLVPTSALSAYPILTNGASPTCGDGQGKISFGMPAMVSPTHFVVGASTFAVPGVPTFGAPTTAFSNPDQTAPTDSPREPTGLLKMDPQTPLTPKEAAVTTSQAFFQTPGTLGSTTSPPASRRRGSAQRRLDIGHPTAN